MAKRVTTGEIIAAIFDFRYEFMRRFDRVDAKLDEHRRILNEHSRILDEHTRILNRCTLDEKP